MSLNLDSFLEHFMNVKKETEDRFMKVKKQNEELKDDFHSLIIDRDNLKREIVRLKDEIIKLKDRTKKFKNTYEQFCDECITKDKDGILSFDDLYYSFIEWFRESFPDLKVPSKLTIKHSFIDIFGEIYKNKWIGIRLLTIEDEILVLDFIE